MVSTSSTSSYNRLMGIALYMLAEIVRGRSSSVKSKDWTTAYFEQFKDELGDKTHSLGTEKVSKIYCAEKPLANQLKITQKFPLRQTCTLTSHLYSTKSSSVTTCPIFCVLSIETYFTITRVSDYNV